MLNPYIFKQKSAPNKRATPDKQNIEKPTIENDNELQHKNVDNTGGNRYCENAMVESDKICTTPVKKVSYNKYSSSQQTNATISQEGTLKKSSVKNQYSLESSPILLSHPLAPFSCEKSLFNLSPQDNLYSPFLEKECNLKEGNLCCQKKLFVSNSNKMSEGVCNIEYKVLDSTTK